jgi:hypothetical protein
MELMGSRAVVRAALLGLVLCISAAGYAWTASNTAGASRAGDGSHAISGYLISNVVYNFNSTSPQNIDSVTITLSASPTTGSTMKLGLSGSSGGTTWYSCTNNGTTLSCPTTSPLATAWGITAGGTPPSAGSTAASGQLTLVIAD